METLNLKERLKNLDRQRLAAVSESELVSTINQRRYFADLKAEDQWKKNQKAKRRQLRYRRPPLA